MTDDPDYGVFPLRTFLDFDLQSPTPGQCTATLVVGDEHLNPNGVVHGGVLFTMIDTAMGRATLSTLPPGVLCASIEIQIRFLRAISTGDVRVEVGVLRRGRRIIHLEAKTYNSSGELVATAAGSFAVIAGDSEAVPGD